MSVTVLNLTEASTLLRTINKRDIKDVRAIDNDLALVMENGHKIIISRGAVTAVNSPQLVLEFADGDVALGDVFEKLNHIEVASDATAPLTASEVKRYGIKRVVKAKDTAKDKDEEQAEARAEVDDGKPVATLASDGALKQPLAASEVAQKSAIPSSSLTEGSSTEAADNGGGLSFSWPAVAGGLGLLAGPAGGGGGGGGGQSGAAAVPKAGTTLSGATVLGPLNNATITAYDSQGNVIGKPVPVINGRYSLVLDQPDYKGLILLAVRDNTPGVADNFADEAIASSYARVMAYVRNAAGTAPQSEDYLNIGVQLPAVNAPQALQLLNSVIHAQPDSVKINTIAGLNRLALTVEQLMQLAAVSPLPGSTPPHYPVPASALSVIELQWLGISAVNADNLPFLLNKLQSTPNDGSALVSLSQLQQLADAAATARNRILRVAQDNGSETLGAVDLEAVGLSLPVILAAIAASRSDGSEVSRLGSLQSLATRAGAAQEKIRLYADETGQPGAPAPTAEDYRAIGLVKSEADAGGVRAALVTAERVGAINAALHGPGISAAQADTPAEIKRVVVAYNAILDSANGHAGDTGVALTAQQFRDIGLNMAGVTRPSGSGEAKDAAVFSLFTSLIDSVQAAEVATPARLEALGASVTRLIGLAGQPRNQPVMNAPAISEFDTFGVRTLSTEERDAFVAVLQTKGVADFDTLGELQALATSVRAAYGRVRSYADNNGGAAPTLADYQDLAITGISDNAGHREAVSFTVSGDGDKQLRVRQTDAAGNTSTSAVLTMRLDTTAPVKPGMASLVSDSGALGNDLLTNDGRLQAPVPSEAGLRFEYSIDSGLTWSDISQPVKGVKQGGSDGQKSVLLRSRDAAGNVSVSSDVFRFTLDTQAPDKPLAPRLASDTGDSSSDGITSNGQIVPSGPVEPTASFEYSVDGSQWLSLSTPIKGSKDGGMDGLKNVRLRIKDTAGNVSETQLDLGRIRCRGRHHVLPDFNGSTDRVIFANFFESSPARPNVFYGDIGGVTGILWFLPEDKPGLTVIRKQQAGATLTGAEVKAILEAIKIRSLNPENGLERSMDITLVSATSSGAALGGATSRATLVLDTAAPVLDLDANTPGIQAQRSQSVTLDQATSGVPLIKGAMAAPVANDIAMVRLTLPGGNDASNDNLILGGTRFTTRSNIDFSGSLGGVNGVELHYVAGTRLATISRTGGGALDGLQVKAILESLRYSFAPPAVGRVIPIEVVDRANNVGRGEVVLSLDNIVPTQLSTTLLPGSQKAYGVAKMEDVFGNVFFPTTNPHNLSRTEGVAVALPPGFSSAASFLAAMRGISAEWGGTAIVGNANASNPNLKSYTMFNQAVNPGQELAVMQQGGGSDVLGSWLSFTLQRQANKSADDIFINHRGSFTLAHEDLYRAEAAQDKSGTGIDLANIGLLYQIDTGRANKTPTIQVGYDGSRAAVGDVVALFEGNTLLARKVLTSADVGAGNKTVDLTVTQSLAPGEHDIVARYTDTAVRSSNQAPASAQALNASENRYAVLNDLDTTQASGHTAGGPIFSGKVGGANAGDRYVVTVSMDGKVLAFDEVAAGDFAIRLPAGSLAPGLYSDLTITASRVGGSDPGQTTAVQGLKLGWYWAAQSAGDIAGGNGNDDIALGATRHGAATFVQTGAGQDKIIVGSFGRNDNLSATVGDFTLGVDKVEVFNQTLTLANLSRFVTASAGANANDTRLTIDLDGAGPGTLTYTLMLQNVMYNSANTASIFGL